MSPTMDMPGDHRGHSAEISVAELGHPAAAAPQSRKHDLHCRGRRRMPLCHTVNQFPVGRCHVLIPRWRFGG
jgi:hypothetical protein